MEILGKEAIKTIKRALSGVLALSGLLFAGAALAVNDSPGGPAVNELNFQTPVTKIAEELYSLHTFMLIICTVIFLGVFGVMFYSVLMHRKSKGHKASNFHESTTVEIIWTIVPFVIVVLMALPATKAVVAMKDTTNADLTVKVTGYQWKWGYDYVKGPGEGINFLSTLSTPRSEVNGQAPISELYLQEVDNPLVVPVDKKIRIITTANDVVHSWYVPAFGVKQDAIPGFVRDTWFKADKTGTFRGFCTELCGKEHAYMPVVVEQDLHDGRTEGTRRAGLFVELRGLPPGDRQGSRSVPGARRQQDRQWPDRGPREHCAEGQGRDAELGRDAQ
jgi:cytochrome c oxidase subunit 2